MCLVRFDPSIVTVITVVSCMSKAVFPVAYHVHLSVHARIFLFCRYLGGPVPLQSFQIIYYMATRALIGCFLVKTEHHFLVMTGHY